MTCFLCGSSSVSPYRRIKGTQIFRCSSCFGAFVSPRTGRESVQHYYSFQDYRKREKPFTRRYKKAIDLITSYSKGKKVLDVGGGFGLNAYLLAKRNYSVTILEPAVIPYYTKNNNAICWYKKTLETFATKKAGYFDCICLFDVIEHFGDANASMKKINEVTKIGSILYIQTPNYLSLMAKIVRDWSWWMIEDHRTFFSRKALQTFMRRHGWKEEYYTSFEDWTDMYANVQGNFSFIENSILRKAAKGCFFLFFLPLYFILRLPLWFFGLGGLHVGIYRR